MAAPVPGRSGRAGRPSPPRPGPSPRRPVRRSPRRRAALPLGVDPGSSTQVVTVVAPSAGSTTATLTAWERGAGGWTAVLGPWRARVGVGRRRRGERELAPAPRPARFGSPRPSAARATPAAALPYRVVDGDDWWVSDVASPLYNQYARCAAGACAFDESASARTCWPPRPSTTTAVVIDYNRGGTPGAGSAFFLHVSNGAPTAGCVAIDAGSLRLAAASAGSRRRRPLIAIGVG